MTSIVAHLLLKPSITPQTPGRLVRFGETSNQALTRGPLKERVHNCLRCASMPMRVADIAESINDYDSRVSRTLQKLVRDGLVEKIGEPGLGQRFRLR